MKFDSTVTKPVAFKKAKKKTPIITPYSFLGAALAGIVGAGAVFFFIGLIAIADGLPVRVPLKAAGIVGLFVYGVVQLILPLVLYETETITGHDWDGDGYVGEPPPPSEPWRIILEREEGGQLWLNFDSEELRDKAALVATFLLNGSPFSEKALSGTNRPLTRSEFYTLRDLFMFHGLLRWKNPKHTTLGLELTPLGRSTVRKLAESTTPLRIPAPRSSGYALPEPEGEGGEDHDRLL